MSKISFVIPCYGSEHTIQDVVREINSVMGEHADRGYEHEIILINDCSPDNVWQEIVHICEEQDTVTGVNLARNFGQHSALLAGYRLAEGDIVFSLDDDGQAPVDELFLLIDKIEEGYDLVYGCYPTIKQSKFRIFGSWVNAKMAEMLLNKPKGLNVTSFFATRRFVIDDIVRYTNPYPYVLGLVLQSTKNITSVEVHQRLRQSGQSGYTLKKLLGLWLNGFTAFSEKPLRLATYIGICCSIIGFISGNYIIIRKILNPDMLVGYSSTMAVILFVGGVIMLLLGMIGEYVGRIYVSINNAPQYVIKEVIKIDNN